MGQRQSEIIKNHMEVYWHDYASASKGVPITEAVSYTHLTLLTT